MTFFTEIEKNNLKIHTEVQKTPKTKAILSMKSNVAGITTPDFTPHCRAIVTKQHETSRKTNT
jgi:hypothetical protein